ncbi:TonB-dependent receptor [Nitrospirillum sp. BR 11752]|uniref:TonB-dependent receptor n=1 Tax=Nitrospirillum sp. BR 11752 TaxID=3104293 RepID=UPI002E99A400|nr:TonB-dependent receptor [Nitrospirillum sp. BR 11752]
MGKAADWTLGRMLKGMSRASVAGLVMGNVAWAQEAVPPAPEDDTIQEVVVTARRRAENLKDVPVAVTAISADQLQAQGSVNLTDLEYKSPNTTVQVARGSNSTLIAFIRGVGQQDPLWGFEPGVGLYVDDVYIARPQGAVLDIYDVSRIEVLRGPQGTLYGRNTIGGAIKYVTRDMTDQPTANARVEIGSYNEHNVILSGSTPLSEKFAIGGAVAIYRHDGYGHNLYTGADQYNKDVVAGRISAEFKPTETFTIKVAADQTNDMSNAKSGHRETATPAGTPPLADVYDTMAGVGDHNFVTNRGMSLTAEWQVSDQWLFKAISAYRDGYTQTNIDFDNLPQPYLDVPAQYKDHQFSQEVQAVYTGERLQGVAGIYYMDATAAGAFDTDVQNLGLSILTSGSVKTKSIAGFTDLSYDITDDLKVSLGGRYTNDDKTGSVYRAYYLGIRSPAFGGKQQAPFSIRTNYTNDRSFGEFTPRASVSYKLTPDMTGYVSYSKGFKSGGFDMRGDAVLTPDTVKGYNPETVNSYEVGLKGDYLDRRLTLNLAGFYADYSGQQVTTQVPTATGIASFVDNAGASHIYGLELEAVAKLTRQLTAQANVGYTLAQFDKFLSYDLASKQYVDVANTRGFQNTPKWTTGFTLSYLLPFDDKSTLNSSASVSYRSFTQLYDTASILDQPGYTLLDLNFIWTSADDHWQVGLHAKNLTDERYRVGGYPFGGATYANSFAAYYGPPRTLTGTVGLHF